MIKTTHQELNADVQTYIKKWVKENSERINKNILEKVNKK